ncbi:MAG: histidine ammonia-lyase [Candidatus Heimdallarchaeota archaeon]|nr:histidine ammonia-lyase [Candidatus Heimdallarchaeota archaeon]MCK4609776.1 histidine ammonia-lyase [Candidatus Heimdallarchaeota archaeon]
MVQEIVVLDGDSLTIDSLLEVTRFEKKVKISKEGTRKIKEARKIIEAKLEKNETIYGVSTGFGKLSNTIISPSEREILQKNLIKSHSIGFGPYLPDEIVLGAMVIELNSFCRGGSGVRIEITEMLEKLINERIIPLVPSIGSLGASGDLSPLAYIARIFIGEGKAKLDGKVLKGSEILAELGLSPLELKAKEGLSLINGTHVLTSFAAHTVSDSMNVLENSVITVSLTLEAFEGNISAFSSFIMELRPHLGQMRFAEAILNVLKGSDLLSSQPKRIQDPYSIRCSPQVHGAILDVVEYCKNLVEVEINSTTDNPLISLETSEVVSGGNFHGEPIGLAMDYLCIAMTELGNISERRVNLLLDSTISGLPSFLIQKPGLNSGLMMIQYADAAIAAENKILASPASIDNISVSANQEDHVSMGLTASKKAYHLVKNVVQMIAIEFYTAYQALGFKEDLNNISEAVQEIYEVVRKEIPPLKEDKFFDEEVKWISERIENQVFTEMVKDKMGHILGDN